MPSRWRNDLALVAATVMATVAVQRHLKLNQGKPNDAAAGDADPPHHADPAEVAATMGNGRLAHTPWQIPAAGSRPDSTR